MKRIIRLTESDLTRIVRRVLNEGLGKIFGEGETDLYGGKYILWDWNGDGTTVTWAEKCIGKENIGGVMQNTVKPCNGVGIIPGEANTKWAGEQGSANALSIIKQLNKKKSGQDGHPVKIVASGGKKIGYM